MALSFLRLKAVQARTGLGRSTLYARIAAGKFPKSIRLGGRAVGWLEHDIEAYLAVLVAMSRGGMPASAEVPHGR